ncbi:DUF2512 family protein [Salirhabdus sp. Marseille-P4669]|uniref:DUF2512 family protein n=1 Tax=Salirhabdus sp. Marseille-P4669 TaxID=2042310 RepID=UPI000C79D0E1|nr:DUF2512 family protein [Salirhabdus sp. Marseille-P4669]
MKHGLALLIKFGLVAIVVFSIFSAFQNVNVWNGLFISIVLVAAAYLLGDLLILRRFGNVTATLADFALSFLVLFFYGIVLGLPYGHAGNAAAFSAMFIALGEVLFHFFIQHRLFRESEFTDEDQPHVRQLINKGLRTETSDEVFPYDVRRKNEKKEKKE